MKFSFQQCDQRQDTNQGLFRNKIQELEGPGTLVKEGFSTTTRFQFIESGAIIGTYDFKNVNNIQSIERMTFCTNTRFPGKACLYLGFTFIFPLNSALRFARYLDRLTSLSSYVRGDTQFQPIEGDVSKGQICKREKIRIGKENNNLRIYFDENGQCHIWNTSWLRSMEWNVDEVYLSLPDPEIIYFQLQTSENQRQDCQMALDYVGRIFPGILREMDS